MNHKLLFTLTLLCSLFLSLPAQSAADKRADFGNPPTLHSGYLFGDRDNPSTFGAVYARGQLQVDAQGNQYIAGSSFANWEFDGTIFNINGGFLAKVDSSQNLVWLTGIHAPNNIGNIGLIDLPGGDLILGGKFSDSLTIEGTTLYDQDNSSDFFLARFSNSGQLIWLEHIECTGGTFSVGGLCLDNQGNLLWTGGFAGEITFQGTTFSAPQLTLQDLFLFRVDPQGNLIRSAHFFGLGHERTRCIAVDGSDNIYVGGRLTGGLRIGSDSITVPDPTHPTGFLAKLNSNFEGQWIRKLVGDDKTSEAKSIAVTPGGRIFLAGYMVDASPTDTATFGNLSLPFENEAHFLTRYESDGSATWARAISSNDLGNLSNQLVIDAQQNVYLAASNPVEVDFGSSHTETNADISQDAYLAQYSAFGALNWVKVLPFTGSSFSFLGNLPYSLDLHPVSQDIYLSGTCSVTQLMAGSQTLQTGSEASFLVRVSAGVTVARPPRPVSPASLLYPNPSAGSFHLRSELIRPGDYKLQIFDAAGRQVPYHLDLPGKGELEFSLGKLPAGLYQLRLESGTQVLQQKLILAP